MSVIELKSVLHKQIDTLQTVDDLEGVYQFISSIQTNHILFDDTTPEFMEELKKGVSSVRTTNLTSSEQLKKEIKGWFTK